MYAFGTEEGLCGLVESGRVTCSNEGIQSQGKWSAACSFPSKLYDEVVRKMRRLIQLNSAQFNHLWRSVVYAGVGKLAGSRLAKSGYQRGCLEHSG